jgi:hypothetical protein
MNATDPVGDALEARLRQAFGALPERVGERRCAITFPSLRSRVVAQISGAVEDDHPLLVVGGVVTTDVAWDRDVMTFLLGVISPHTLGRLYEVESRLIFEVTMPALGLEADELRLIVEHTADVMGTVGRELDRRAERPG